MEWTSVTDALAHAWSLLTSSLTQIAGNEVLMAMFVGGSLIPIGFKIFKRAKRAVK